MRFEVPTEARREATFVQQRALEVEDGVHALLFCIPTREAPRPRRAATTPTAAILLDGAASRETRRDPLRAP